MTTRTLTGTYSAGYTLSPSFAELIIAPSARVGGAGVRANAFATIENEGSIVAGVGVAGGAGHFQGGVGNIGVNLAAGGRLVNFGALTAGQGGAGAYNAQTGNGYAGGAGGSGIVFPVGGAIVDHATIAGGAGGAGAHGAVVGRGNSGYGGAGGAGIVLKVSGSLAIGAGDLVVGGQGGGGGKSYAYSRGLGFPGGGGAGGVGINLSGPETITNMGAIAGGVGGTGGSGYGYGARGGVGGLGMIDVYAGVSLSNTGLIEGGQGGVGGYRRGTHTGYPGVGGTGGVGVKLVAAGFITNLGTITGGAGGAGGTASGGGPAGPTGAAGVGVWLEAGGVVTNGSSLNGAALISGAYGVLATGGTVTVINFGTIAGAGYSVRFSGGGTLIAEAGAQFVGQISGRGGGTLVVAGGAGAISGLGGSGVMAGTQNGAFKFFSSYVIGAGGAWALTGTNILGRNQTMSDDGALVVSGSLDLLGGVVNVAAGAGLVFTGSGSVLQGAISGAGNVAFVGGSNFLSGYVTLAHLAVSGATLTTSGITATGTVSLASSELLISSPAATLVGGAWALSDNPGNKIMGLSSGDGLINQSTISGAGMLGAGQMGLTNGSDGTVNGNGRNTLIIDTGTNQIANSGIIEATGVGGVTVQSAVLNGDRLEANGGTLTVNGSVTGTGAGLIVSGALVFNAAFSQGVAFTGTTGMLELAQSQGFTGSITGFSTTGGTSLDLRDIGFVSSTEATFSGTATSGVLTVTDGTHTAHITLMGNYLASTFTASSDGHGGTIVVDPAAAKATAPPRSQAPPHRFIAAMASLGGAAGGVAHLSAMSPLRELTLVAPRAMTT